jgi:hypothetical protein
MKWALLAMGVLILMVALAALVGAMLPARHRASRMARIRASPEAVYAVLAGPPDWRTGVRSFGVLADQDGKRRWWEEDDHGHKVAYELVEQAPPTRMVTRIADETLPFGGTWTYEISRAETGGSEVRITEDGVIHNLLFRFMARFLFGYTRTMEQVLGDLGVKFG